MSGGLRHLIQMANDIGTYFASEPERAVALDGIATHVRRYWEPRMRRQMYAHLDTGGAGLDELPLAALRQLATKERAEQERKAAS